ncbi:MAG: hypothetical protein ACYC6N_07285 [Pirellulaceae bacterium]
MLKSLSSLVLWGATLVIVTGVANGGADRHLAGRNHQPCCENCGIACSSCDLCDHTVMVPMMVTETRMKTCVVKKQVEREETYTVFKLTPVKRTYTKEKCYLKDEVRTKTVTQEKCHRVSNVIVSEFPVQVPITEVRSSVVQNEVCIDGQMVLAEQPCESQVTVLGEEWRSATCCKEDVVFETTKRDIDYCVQVPKTYKQVCAEETEYKLMPVEKTRKVTVCVPEIVEVPEEVTVCKMVAQSKQCCPKCCRK